MAAVTFVLGALLLLAGVVLLFDIAGAAGWLIRNLTSRSLGELAPGYAASRSGMRAYAVVLVGLGLAFAGTGIALGNALAGLALVVLGAGVFLVASAIVVAGEVRTYRALPRRPGPG